MQIIPLNKVPSQTLTVILNTQECVIHVYQRTPGLFLDLGINGSLVLAGVICQNRNLLVLNSYIGLFGDLAFMDTLGSSDPDYSGLGTRWLLGFLLPGETLPPAIVVPLWVPSSAVGVTLPPTATPTPTPTGTGTPTPTPTSTPTPSPVAPSGSGIVLTIT